jgi:signal transduction histidine kinase
MSSEANILKWRFDISTFRLIGRDLITDRVTALFELVKNCYDANSQNVYVIFENTKSDNKDTIIRIEDDGYGMSFEDIRDKWMVIGTSSKRVSPYSPEPYRRKCVGEKGIGRFAIDKLGDFVSIITKKAGDSKWLQVDIDWADYYQGMSQDDGIRLFTDVENRYKYIDAQNVEESGTKLIIRSVREPWMEKNIRHLITEISKIVSPFTNLSFPFNVRVQANEYGIDMNAVKTLESFKGATVSFEIKFNQATNEQQIVRYDKEHGHFAYSSIPIKSFGGVKIKVYFFDDAARRKFKESFPNASIDGFKVYRDGVIATPFAETNESPDKKRDILGIDKRLWQDIFNRVSTREFIGVIEITSAGNPQIIDATNRQDFVDNNEYRELKDFIIKQLNAIQEYKIAQRNEKKDKTLQSLQGASNEMDELVDAIRNVVNRNPELKDSIEPLITRAGKTGKTVKNAIKEHKKAIEEINRKENVYLSVMSLRQFAIDATHAIRTTLNQIRDRIEFFYRYYPDPEEEDLFKEYSKEMFELFKSLNRIIDYILSYSQSNLKPEPIDLNGLLEEILNNYQDRFLQNGITITTNFPEKLIIDSNKQIFRDIIQNVIDNSIKSMSESEEKIIKCSLKVRDDSFDILISDTGVGIPLENRELVFALYYTTTEEKGGAGIGLYIVRTRVESLKGTVSVIDSEFGPVGTTIKITIPFKR